jgi:hypothetical protein
MYAPKLFQGRAGTRWNRTRNGLGAGAAVVDPTPCTSRRKWGTDRHHLPGRHPEPCLPHGVAWPDPKAPGARRSVRRSRREEGPSTCLNGGETGQAMGSAPPYPAPRRREWAGRPSCPGHLPADQQGSPGYERGARRAPREPGGECSPRAGDRSVGPSRQAPRWSQTRPPCHSASPGTRCALSWG